MKANPFVFPTNKDLEEDTLSLSTEFTSSTSHQSKVIRLRPREVTVESIHERFIKQIVKTIETRISDPGLCVSVLANENSMSNVQLYRKLKKLTGRTPNELIREFRLTRAASLLNQEAGHVAEIAYSVGFTNLSYFTKCFRETFGSCPSRYKTTTGHRPKSISY